MCMPGFRNYLELPGIQLCPTTDIFPMSKFWVSGDWTPPFGTSSAGTHVRTLYCSGMGDQADVFIRLVMYRFLGVTEFISHCFMDVTNIRLMVNYEIGVIVLVICLGQCHVGMSAEDNNEKIWGRAFYLMGRNWLRI